MKVIDDTIKAKLIPLSDVKIGQCFLFESSNMIYMRIKPKNIDIQSNTICIVNIENGVLLIVDLSEGEFVYPIEVECHIVKKG